MKEKFKYFGGLVILILIGFLAYCAVTGFGVMIGLIFVIFPVWQIVLGTILGSVGVLLYLMEKKDD